MAEGQGEFPGIATPARIKEPLTPHHRTYPIPRHPEYGQQRIEDQNEPYSYGVIWGAPAFLPNGKTGRILQDIRLTKEQFERLHEGRSPKTSRRIAGRTVRDLLVVEVPAQHILFASELPRDFVYYTFDSSYRKRLAKRDGEIKADPRYITTKDPRDFDPAGAGKNIMHLYVHKAFIGRHLRTAPVHG